MVAAADIWTRAGNRLDSVPTALSTSDGEQMVADNITALQNVLGTSIDSTDIDSEYIPYLVFKTCADILVLEFDYRLGDLNVSRNNTRYQYYMGQATEALKALGGDETIFGFTNL